MMRDTDKKSYLVVCLYANKAKTKPCVQRMTKGERIRGNHSPVIRDSDRLSPLCNQADIGRCSQSAVNQCEVSEREQTNLSLFLERKSY
ncbi:MAG: hypothetical protein K2H82_09075 [Oscillospiraceae bacterium]|nr:hypothetical protein [Oscillospiraceae bacterium]